MNMKHLESLLVTLLFLTGCNTVPERAEPECPPVTCGWTAENTCPAPNAFSSESTTEAIEGGTCWVYTSTCLAPSEPVSAECVPSECKRNPFTTCTVTP